MALVTVIIFAAVAGILAAGLYHASGSRIKQARQEMRFDKAFFTAEAGIEHAKDELRRGATNDGVFFGGATNYGEGAFRVNAWPNVVGTNTFVVIRSTGVVENVRRVIETEIWLTPFLPPNSDGGFCIYGTNTALSVKGDSKLDGSDWNLPSTLGGSDAAPSGNPTNPGVLYVSPSTTIDQQKTDSIIGEPPITNAVGEYNETYWMQLVAGIMPDALYSDGDNLGTRESPVITLLPAGTTMFNGNRSGAGILIVPGDAMLKITGTFDYEGLVILLGDGQIDLSEDLVSIGTATIFGSVICVGGNLNVDTKGTFDLKYSTQALANLARLQVPPRLEVIYWKEVK
ncbi:MAG: hypothetical protein PHP98_01250 [Kiritimatiellae bacterium]|nr:hypothetical protein [Kiritimatiellia bacterium]